MAKNTSVKPNLRENSYSIVSRSLNFITWVAATLCFVIGVGWSLHQPPQPARNVTPTTPQVAPLQPSHKEISSSPVGGEPWLHSEGKRPVKVAVKSQSFSAPIKITKAAEEKKSTPAISPEHNTTLPPSQYPEIHGEDVTPLLEALPEPSPIAEVTPPVALEESPAITFSIPTQFESQIVKEVKLTQPEKVIALTFDDGPWPNNTVQILNILKQHNVKATFFWVGECLKAYPQLAKQVVAEGHAVGNHTWHHLYRKFSKTEAAKEIEDTAELIYKTTGVRTSLFRPPGGVMDNGVTDYAKQKNMRS